MRAMLEGVVLNGTGKLAQLDGYTSAGKTGTAQKIDPATGRYSATQLIASFVGFAPINNPALTILVQLDSPVGPHEGGSVAAPVFERIAEQVLAYRNVPHDLPITSKVLRATRGAKSSKPDLADIADFDPAQTQNADALNAPASTDPAATVTAPAAAAESPTVEIAEGATIPAPNLAGKTVREVIEICERLGLNPVLVGNGIVEEQQPEAGATVRRGGSVMVHFGRAAQLTAVRAEVRAGARARSNNQ
jgi:cell division protein FtsI (penicillin-binding protein 3)